MKFNRDTISLLNFATDSLIVPMKNQSTWFLNMREEDFEAASKDIFEFMKKFVAKYDQDDSPGEHVCLLHHDLISLEVLLKNSKA